MDEIVKVNNLSFSYSKQLNILKDVTFSVKQGEIFALLGHNGAGKTTIIRILLDFVRGYRGEVSLFGSNALDPMARTKVGFMAEHPITYEYMDAENYLKYFASIAEMKSDTNEKINELLELTGLSAHKGKKLEQYSKGMLQRLNLSRALISDPELLIMDEPIIGLDPLGQKLIEEVALDRKKKGKSVLVNTHAVSFAEKVADRVAFLMGGQIRAVVTRDQFDKTDFPLCIDVDVDSDLLSLIKKNNFEVSNIYKNSHAIKIHDRDDYFRFVELSLKEKIIIDRVYSDKISLSNMFMEYAQDLAKEDASR